MSHRRRNPLSGEWVVCSPHRTQRPWKGASEATPARTQVEYDPTCALCPCNQRSGGPNPDYKRNWLFQNDFAALREAASVTSQGSAAAVNDDDATPSALFQSAPADGKCIVHCYSCRHDLTLADLSVDDLAGVLATWRAAWSRLVGVPLASLQPPTGVDHLAESAGVTWPDPTTDHCFRHALVFENKGAMMGCSMPHPHCQIWASDFMPTVVATELAHMAQFRTEKKAGGSSNWVLAADPCCMLCEYAQQETKLGERVVVQNEHFLAVVPYWATWPFEVLVLPKTHMANLTESNEEAHLVALAQVMSAVTKAYDALFQCSFPYSMGIHQDKRPTPMHMHIHFFPPLLRSATVRKFLVGFEMLGEPQRDLTPEDAAKRLRDLVV